MSPSVTVQKFRNFLTAIRGLWFLAIIMFEVIEPGLGLVIESQEDPGEAYSVTLKQMAFGGNEQEIVLNEDELMGLVETVAKERPDFARGVSRIYFRQQKAKRKLSPTVTV